MSEVDEFTARYEYGKPTFLKLFNMSKSELLEIVQDICSGAVGLGFFDNCARVEKNIVNDEAERITIRNWDVLEITPLGIKFKKEQGNYVNVVAFHKYFNLEGFYKTKKQS